MPLPLKPDAVPKPSRVYSVGQKDKDVIDEAFNKLHDQVQPTKFSYLCFVVWRKTPSGRKGRMVADIRGLNQITESIAARLERRGEERIPRMSEQDTDLRFVAGHIP